MADRVRIKGTVTIEIMKYCLGQELLWQLKEAEELAASRATGASPAQAHGSKQETSSLSYHQSELRYHTDEEERPSLCKYGLGLHEMTRTELAAWQSEHNIKGPCYWCQE